MIFIKINGWHIFCILQKSLLLLWPFRMRLDRGRRFYRLGAGSQFTPFNCLNWLCLWEPKPLSPLKFKQANTRGLKGEQGQARPQTGSNPAPAPFRWGNMKPLIAFLLAVTAVFGFVGSAEASIFADLFAYLKINALKGAGQIPWSAIMILLATGIIGILGIRRKGKKF